MEIVAAVAAPTAQAAMVYFEGWAGGTFSDMGASATRRTADILKARQLAVGIAPAGRKQYRLAIRAPDAAAVTSLTVQRLTSLAKNEIDLRVTGIARKQASNFQRMMRPVTIGCSVGHVNATAGTIGGFVKRRRGKKGVFVLSNNHVLANENAAARGDVILQPGPLDGGKKRDRIATLTTFGALRQRGANLADSAIAMIEEPTGFDHRQLGRLGLLSGVRPSSVDEGLEVAKIGRTTGLTRGRVTAFEMDVSVEYGLGILRFENQIEIEGEGRKAFSAGGDSGSLIVDPDCLAVAQLFAGTDQGGSNGKGLTYATPIESVLDSLEVDLLC
jgi:hypothetical protein